MYFLSILLSREKLTINISFALFWNLFFNSHSFSIQLLRTNSYVSFASFTLSCFAFASERYSWIIVFCELFKCKKLLSGSFSKLSNLSNCHFVSAPEISTFYSLN